MHHSTRVQNGKSSRLWDVDIEARTCTCRAHGPGSQLRIRVRKDRVRPELSCRLCDRANRVVTPAQRRIWRLWREYGLSVEEYELRLAAQGGKCAICERPMDEPQIDHDHETGSVRGLLCRSCNIALGHFEDDSRRLRRAVRYLAS